MYIAGLLKGLGGNLVVLNAAQYAFVADVSLPRRRSFSLGLMLLISWFGRSLSDIVSITSVVLGALPGRELVANTFAIALGTWALYVLYAAAALPETCPQTIDNPILAPVEEGSGESSDAVATANQSRKFTFPSLSALCEPFVLIFHHPTLRWLSLVSFALYFSGGAVNLLVLYHDVVFGRDSDEVRTTTCIVSRPRLTLTSPAQTGIIAACKNVASAISILLFLPLFSTIYQCLTSKRVRSTSQIESGVSPTERTMLLPGGARREEPRTANVNPTQDDQSAVAAARQERVLCMICLSLQLVGMLAAADSGNWIEVGAGTHL